MKHKLNLYPLLFLVLGFLGLTLRTGVYATATDSKGLLIPATAPELALWALTAAAAVAALLLCRRSRPADPAGLPGIPGAVVLAAAIAIIFPAIHAAIGALVVIHRVLSVAAIAALLALAVFHGRKIAPSFLCYAGVCVFLCVHLIIGYQMWSERTQLQDYVFGLAAVLCLTLFAYYRAAHWAGMKTGAFPGFLGLMGIYFCLTALPGGDWQILYAAAALWLAGELSAASREDTVEAKEPV